MNISGESIFLETESFTKKGGWKVDQQFVETMGSSYLLAHGMGIPVENAKTTFKIDKSGDYRLWVRTMNWVPGDWEAPGRFQISLNGETLPKIFGTGSDRWRWEFVDTGALNEGENTIFLVDLTGFDGRCDALFLTDDLNFTPPDDGIELKTWRRTIMGKPEIPADVRKFDLVIVGGGIAGSAAALTAADQGLNTVLIHDRPVLGGNASSEIRVHTEGIHGKSEEILKQLDTKWWPNGSARSVSDDEKRTNAMTVVENLQIFTNWRAYDAHTEGDTITSVDARHIESGEEIRFKAPLFIDTTGDGWIGFWAGAEYRYGRESFTEFGEGIAQWGDLWSPKEPDNRVMGSSLLWNSKFKPFNGSFPEVPWAIEVSKDMSAVKGDWFWEFSSNDLHQIDDAEKIRDHILRAIYGSFYNAKQKLLTRGFQLEHVGYLLGKRESRRLVGDYIFTYQDAKNNHYFPDTVVEEKREIDVHYQVSLNDEHKKKDYDFISEALFSDVGMYYIPFRSLYSKNISNLLMAGRCFSSTHAGLGGPRVMNTTGQMGIAVGYAASLGIKYEMTPREIYQYHIEELRALIGY